MKLVESLVNMEFSFSAGRVYPLAFVFCLVLVVLKLSKMLIERHKLTQLFRNYPGPPVHWLYGHVNQFRQDGTDMEKLVEWGKMYPMAFPMWFGPFVAFLIIHHPDYAKTLLSSTEPKDDLAYKFLIPWIGDGLLVSQGNKWFRHRRLLTPGFHYDVLKPYVTLMADSAKVMLDKWEALATKDESFELFEYVSLMTLDSIMKCAFSCETNCQIESGTNAYIKAVYEMANLINLRIRTFPYHSSIIWSLSPHGYRFRKAVRISHQHTQEVIRKRKEVLKYEEGFGGTQKKRYLDFLDILLYARDEHQQGLSDEDIRAEVDTFMFEGHDTTASGISWTLYSLACNPDHQQTAREEVLQVLEGKDSMDWEDLNKIPYTTMCIKESLRLYPPVPGHSRQLSKPMTFCDGRTLPAGSRISASVFCLHRNSTVWENPDEFNPLRFLPENSAKRSPHAFIPFSAGPRNCIGQNFAMNEMKVVIALTLQRFHLMTDPEKKPKLLPRLVLRSLNGIHLKIRPVKS
ncbi:hypothetical protein GJAV_G00009910 [Gymnothorax javanicus]|nr:hypothetical protein GJAV_G00009910 [Gymnothorax javanicus]